MKNKLISYIFVIFISSFMLISVILPDKEISLSERRHLTEFPKINQNFTSNLDKYLLDQFPLRDLFRSIKSYYNIYLMHSNDFNAVVNKDGILYEVNTLTNKKSVTNFINHINNIKNTYFKDNKTYISIIPEKSYFLENYNTLDFNYIFNEVQTNTNSTYIDLTQSLNVNDYYKTDVHWKQTNLDRVVNKLSESMSFEYNNNYSNVEVSNFKGSYYSKYAEFIKEDKLEYLINEDIKNSTIKHLEYDYTTIYNEELASSIDGYSLYLGGPSAYIEITNNNSTSNKELIIFRDSFGSSLTPLLVSSYKKITLIDLRYIGTELALNSMDSSDADILFIYSTGLVNNSYSLK